MTTDELEFLISQHLDGTLDAGEQAKLDAALAGDFGGARTLLAEHRRLDAALKASRGSVPAIDHEWLTAQIAARVDEEAEHAASRSFRLPTWGTSLAAAAMLAVGVSLGFVLFRNEIVPATRVTESIASVTVTGTSAPSIASSTGSTGFANVSVGVPANLTPAIVSALYLSDGSGTGRVVIRPAGTSEGDGFE